MSFPAKGDYNGGVCPESHPIAIIQLFYEFFFDTTPFDDLNFVYANGDRTGYGFHGDFINGWTNQKRLGDALRTCTGPNGVDDENCSLNVGSDGSPGHPSTQTPQTPAPAGNVGLNGPLKKLPGQNPPTGKSPGFSGRVRGRNVLGKTSGLFS
jgi:hypothetical protein